jgi:hypothetical protein
MIIGSIFGADFCHLHQGRFRRARLHDQGDSRQSNFYLRSSSVVSEQTVLSDN